MKYMETTNLYDLGYEDGENNNVLQDVKRISLEDNDDPEDILKGIAYELDSEFYFSIVFYNNEHAYSVVKIDGKLYESYLESKEDIESAMDHSYVCDDVAVFILKDKKLECIGY